MFYSKFKSIHGSVRKELSFDDLRVTEVRGSSMSQLLKCNSKNIAVLWQSNNGTAALWPLSHPARLPVDPPLCVGHSGGTTCFDWNPFYEQLIATGSVDTTIMLWSAPTTLLPTSSVTGLCTLRGHTGAVRSLDFHPSAQHVLMSSGVDSSVRIWDVEHVSELCCLNTLSEPYCVSWSHDGALIASTCKDRQMRLFDPRAADASRRGIAAVEAHDASKYSHVLWMNGSHLVTTGFTQRSGRQFSTWDARQLAGPMASKVIDVSASPLIPLFDRDLSILYLGGKGDAVIRMFEITPELPHPLALADFKGDSGQKCLAMLPKLLVDTRQHEIDQVLRLTQSSIECVSFRLLRKSETFQDDLYPETTGLIPGMTASDWLNGSNVPAPRTSLRPARRPSEVFPGQLQQQHIQRLAGAEASSAPTFGISPIVDSQASDEPSSSGVRGDSSNGDPNSASANAKDDGANSPVLSEPSFGFSPRMHNSILCIGPTPPNSPSYQLMLDTRHLTSPAPGFFSHPVTPASARSPLLNTSECSHKSSHACGISRHTHFSLPQSLTARGPVCGHTQPPARWPPATLRLPQAAAAHSAYSQRTSATCWPTPHLTRTR
eukprot:gnl/Spiro4/17446_TR9280_c0_g1_i1.p1 gnl/Spiro4/17446_TR9280_c0_g1~~gnl/Spiro4/17446_TR9280_c0_g1_i1.p1  ORF type:complete len:603 (-),score=91.21 gnl/Spiro4/17446_TR9280_c0_g1_i1:296-2104(-)